MKGRFRLRTPFRKRKVSIAEQAKEVRTRREKNSSSSSSNGISREKTTQ